MFVTVPHSWPLDIFTSPNPSTTAQQLAAMKRNLTQPHHTWCTYYLLTPWSRVLLEKLTGFAANQEIPRILWNPKVHYRTHKRPPPVPTLSQLNKFVYRDTLHFTYLRSLVFWDVMQPRLVVTYQHFRTIFRSYFQDSGSPKSLKCLNLGDGTDRLSRNVCN